MSRQNGSSALPHPHNDTATTTPHQPHSIVPNAEDIMVNVFVFTHRPSHAIMRACTTLIKPVNERTDTLARAERSAVFRHRAGHGSLAFMNSIIFVSSIIASSSTETTGSVPATV